MRFTPVAWLGLVAAVAVLVGALAPWGSLSEVDEQAKVVAATRWILAVLALVAGALLFVGWRWASFVAAALFLAAAVLGWTELRYEGNQSQQYGIDGPLWGLWFVVSGACAGLAAALAQGFGIGRVRPVD